MKTAIHCVRLLVLLISLFGYRVWLGRHVKAEFTWGILYAGIGCVTFFAGLAGLLTVSAVLICGVGVFLAAYAAIKKQIKKANFCVADLYFIALCLFLTWVVYDRYYTAPDDFSHWATVLKAVVGRDRFPNDSDTYIIYQSYPTGTASIIYYFVKITGMDIPWFIMMAQNSFLVAVMAGLFAFSKNILGGITSMAFSLIVLSQNSSFVNLTVDTVMPVAAVGCFALYLYLRENESAERLFLLLPYLCFLPAIKTSSFVFALFLSIFASVTFYKKRKTTGKNGLMCFLFPAAPLFTFFTWQAHVWITFENGAASRHGLSFSAFRTIFLSKGSSAITQTISNFLRYEFSFENGFWVLFLLILCFFFVAGKLPQKEGTFVRKTAIVLVLFYFIYQAGTLGMYLFSMPGDEAVKLACHHRYRISVFQFVECALFMLRPLFYRIPETGAGSAASARVLKHVVPILSVLCLIAACFAAVPHFRFYIR